MRIYHWNGERVTEAEFGHLVGTLLFERGWTLMPPSVASPGVPE
jgi:hypothetical protein